MSDATPASVQADTDRYRARLDEAQAEHAKVCEELGDAIADHGEAYTTAHLLSVARYPERRVGEHESYAKDAAKAEFRRMTILKVREKALSHELRALERQLSNLQTDAVSLRAVT